MFFPRELVYVGKESNDRIVEGISLTGIEKQHSFND